MSRALHYRLGYEFAMCAHYDGLDLQAVYRAEKYRRSVAWLAGYRLLLWVLSLRRRREA